MARENATVVVHGRDRAQAGRVAQDIIKAGKRACVVVGDLTVDEEVQALVSEAQALAGRVDIPVNTAGGSGPTEDWFNTTPETWTSVYDRNVLAAVRITSLLLPAMRQVKWSRLINISSLAALMSPANRPNYSAAKAAISAVATCWKHAPSGPI